MRYTLIALAFAVTLAAPPALRAQHDAIDSSSHDHHAMMAEHHSVATVDLLVSYRDSLKLTDDQLGELADLREHFAHSSGHAMHGSGMGTGMATGPDMAMEHARPRPDRITYHRVPGKMVPRIRHSPQADHCPMCPFGVLTMAQRERAHQLLVHQHQG